MKPELLKSKKFRLFGVVFFVLVATFFLVNYFSGYYRFVLDVLYPAQKIVEKADKTTKDIFLVLTDIQKLLKENEELKKEIQRLQYLKDKVQTLEFENFKLKELLNFSKKYKKFKVVGANVIGYPADTFVKAVIVDAGIKSGVSIGDYVVSDGVLIGKVIKVGDFSSTVLLTNDPRFKIPCRTRKTREFVLYSGKGELDFVKPFQDVRLNDTIETASVEGYPKGIPVGKISLIKYEEGDFFKKVQVKPFVKQFQIEYVLIIGKK